MTADGVLPPTPYHIIAKEIIVNIHYPDEFELIGASVHCPLGGA